MENFCSSLRELATNIFKFEKKKMLPFTKEELNLYQDEEIVTFVEKES